MNGEGSQTTRWGLVLGSLVVIVLLLLTANFYVVRCLFGDIESPGIFGDLFGASNALFSGLAFAGVIIAILLQRKELSLQRKELEQTRNEMKEQRKQFEAQSEEMKKQNIERAFHSLIVAHNEIRGSIEWRGDTADASGLMVGRDALGKYYGEFLGAAEGIEFFDEEFTPRRRQELLLPHYDEWLTGKKHQVLPFFNHFAVILRFLSRHHFGRDSLFSEQLRASLSPWELALIFYDCSLRPASRIDADVFNQLGFSEDIAPGTLARDEDIDLLQM